MEERVQKLEKVLGNDTSELVSKDVLLACNKLPYPIAC